MVMTLLSEVMVDGLSLMTLLLLGRVSDLEHTLS